MVYNSFSWQLSFLLVIQRIIIIIKLYLRLGSYNEEKIIKKFNHCSSKSTPSLEINVELVTLSIVCSSSYIQSLN